MKRTLNIISRAVNDFGLEVDMSDSLQYVLDQAMNLIEKNIDYDYISECERNRHYDHISWSDGKGFELEADGEFISSDDRNNHYYRYEVKDKKSNCGEYNEIPWYNHTDEDYILVYDCIDTDGLRVRLVCK